MNNLSIYIKPYRSLPDIEIAKKVREMGIGRVELPVKVSETCMDELLAAKEAFLKEGIEIYSITSQVDEKIFIAMNKAGIKVLRIMLPMKAEEDYLEAEARIVGQLKNAVSLCEKYDVTIVIQPHNGRYVANLYELKSILDKVGSKYIKAIWDFGHSGLAGEIPQKCVDTIFKHLHTVNLKSAYYKRIKRDDGSFVYKPYYTIGKQSPVNWEECIKLLCEKGFDGDYCIHAEYTDPDNIGAYTVAHNTDGYLKEDLKYLKTIIEFQKTI